MDAANGDRINNLVIEYISKKDKSILNEIEYLLKIQEYESWKLKNDLKLVEHPDKFRNDPHIQYFTKIFHHSNAYSKYHLILPLFLYLFVHHKSSASALDTALSFMFSSKDFLKPGDYAKTKTGVQRFITNSRFAALELRNLGLLRSDSKRFYKTWELSLFGILVSSYIYLDYKDNLANAFFNNYRWEKAKDSSFKILHKYISIPKVSTNIKDLFNHLFDEDIVVKYFELHNRKFAEFQNLIIKVIETSYNLGNRQTKDLVTFLNSINSDTEIRNLADSIKLRKDISVNLADVYKIINRRRTQDN